MPSPDDLQDTSPDAAEFLAEMPGVMAHSVVWLVVVFSLAALAWSYFSWVDVVITAPGIVRPEGKTFAVGTTFQARVQELTVREGDAVKKGQIVAWVESRAAAGDLASLQEARERRDRARRELRRDLPTNRERMRQQVMGEQRKLDSLDAMRVLAAREPESIRQDMSFQRRALELELERKAEQVRTAQLQIEQADRNVEFARATLATHRRMAEKGLVSKLRIAELENAAQDAGTRAGTARAALREAAKAVEKDRSALRQLEVSLADRLDAASRREQELSVQIKASQSRLGELAQEVSLAEGEAESRMESAEEEYRKAASATAPAVAEASDKAGPGRFPLRAPVTGLVSSLAMENPGEVLEPGEALMQILPHGSPLVVEATVANRDTGHLELGLPARIKFEAFPREKYGTLTGKLARVSPDAREDPKLGYVYEITCSLDRDYLEGEGRKARLFPGLEAQVEIVTRKERVLDILLKPFRDLGEQVRLGK
ncbi:MAG: HlyD family efflux transporter periplasmic adaptor subunit [Armatimonadetes bacterium]|nr:HlyD family efflux transporter periplasmic adaptor subunit [Armatimonadota bacterium]